MRFKIPETLDGLSRAQLVELESKATDAFDEQRDDPKLDAAGMTRLRALTAFIAQVRTVVSEADAKAEAERIELQQMVANVHPDDDEQSGDDGTDTDAEPDAQPDGDDDGTADTPGDDGTDDDTDGDDGDDTEVAPTQDAPLAPNQTRPAAQRTKASGKTGRLPEKVLAGGGLNRGGARRQVAPAALPSRRAVITAAADLPGYAPGHKFSKLADVGAAMDARFRTFPDQSKLSSAQRKPMFLRQGLATVTLPARPGAPTADGRNDYEAIETAADVSRLTGGSLVAAGGWCAPSETIWDLCDSLITTDGALDLPTITFTRTGIRYPKNVDLLPMIDQIGFHYTEADSLAGKPKECFTFPCPEWEEVKMECDGICIRGDIVRDSSWPELYTKLLAQALALHAHKMNARWIKQLVDGSTAVTFTGGGDIAGDDTTTGILGAILLAAADYRARMMASETLDLEVILPSWLRQFVIADLARRVGCCAPNQLSTAQVTAMFSGYNLRVQWVRDWQDFFDQTPGGLGNQLTPAKTWPTTVKWLLYAPGAWVKGTRNIITLETVYDSTLLEQNEYTRLFTEECSLLLNRCYPSYVYEMPICPSGATTMPVERTCVAAAPGPAPAPTPSPTPTPTPSPTPTPTPTPAPVGP